MINKIKIIDQESGKTVIRNQYTARKDCLIRWGLSCEITHPAENKRKIIKIMKDEDILSGGFVVTNLHTSGTTNLKKGSTIRVKKQKGINHESYLLILKEENNDK